MGEIRNFIDVILQSTLHPVFCSMTFAPKSKCFIFIITEEHLILYGHPGRLDIDVDWSGFDNFADFETNFSLGYISIRSRLSAALLFFWECGLW